MPRDTSSADSLFSAKVLDSLRNGAVNPVTFNGLQEVVHQFAGRVLKLRDEILLKPTPICFSEHKASI